MKYVSAIGSRYGALLVQFLLVILVANKLSPEEAGHYFLSFSLAATLFCLVGFGLPDGLVVTIGQALASGRTAIIRDTMRRSVLWGLATAVVVFGAGALIAILFRHSPILSLLTAAWCLLYGMVFVGAQGLVALRFSALGAFFFYSSTNLCLLFTSVAYLLLIPEPNLYHLMGLTVLAAAISSTTALAMLWRKTKAYDGDERIPLAPVSRDGRFMAASRMVQSTLYWVPVWIAAAIMGSAEAAVLATAGRLLIAVSAAIASLRFSVRPSIVAATANNDWKGIENLGRRISLAATLFTLAAMLGLWLIGRPVLDILLGQEYAAAWAVLMVLLLGALAEAIGGPVDEVLKMTGHSRVVFLSLVIVVTLEAALALALGRWGLLAIAAAQPAAFAAMYSYQIYRLWRIKGIVIMPLLPTGQRR